MNRRRFLSVSAGLGAGGALLARAAARPRVVVVGAGIVGASIAYHLARRGAEVTVCEKERPGAGATGKSFAWINSTFSKQPRSYFELNRDGMAAWRRLERGLQGTLRVQWGGSVHHPCAITGMEASGGRVQRVRTRAGVLETDVLVLAAGVDTPALAAMAGVSVPLKEAPGVLAHTVPLPSRLERVTLAPGAHVVQRLSGRVVTGSSFGGSPLMAAAGAHGLDLLREAARFLPFLEGALVEQVTVGFRVMPKDELPIVGFADDCSNLYVAAMHSGVTLAPLVGQLAATEILDGVAVDCLRPFRLSRFA